MLPTFARFLTTANKYVDLIIDLCNEPDIISRAQLLHYLEQHAVPSIQKEATIDELLRAAILLEEVDQGYTVNIAVVDLVAAYERRGRLTSATFLRDQIVAIATLTDQLQRHLFAEEPEQDALLDTVDDLYRLVRDVREAGLNHYIACMRVLGEIKRTAVARSLDERLTALETVQRRHIDPLRELIDPSGVYVHRIATLRRRLGDLTAQREILANSQELDSRRQRLMSDVQYIDHTLLQSFAKIVDTTRTLLKSLIDEKQIKDALAACLGQLNAVWSAAATTTVLAPARQVTQVPARDTVEAFVADIVHRRLLPRPTPLVQPPVQRQSADDLVIRDQRIWDQIKIEQSIESWPTYVLATFGQYESAEQLKAIVLPLVSIHPSIRIHLASTAVTHILPDVDIQLVDFGVTWGTSDADRTTTP